MKLSKNNFLFLLVAICSLLFGFMDSLYGQESVYFEHISTDEGLSQNDINCIYQDKQGFLWFGTHDGLNKYDGYDFTVYNPSTDTENSISSNLIVDIVEDKNENLWIATTGSGLNFYNKKTNTFTVYKHEDGNESSLNSDYVLTLYIDSENRLWVGTDKGLNMLELENQNKTVEFKHFSREEKTILSEDDETNVEAIFEDGRKQLWIGGFNGLYKLSRDENGGIYFKQANSSIGIPNITVYSLAEDKYGRLIIGTTSGLYYQDLNAPNRTVQVSAEHVNDILVDDYNTVWVGTNQGLLQYENTSNKELPFLKERFNYDPKNTASLSKNIVESLLMDATGVIWIGTNGGGLNKYDPERKRFRHVKKTLDPNSLSYDKIRTIFEDSNNTLWIGTEGGGLNMMPKGDDNREYNTFQIFESIPKPFAITEIHSGNKKKILIGAEGTPNLFELDITDPKKVREENIKPILDVEGSVFSLLEDSQRNIWIGSYSEGVYRWLWDNASQSYKKDVLSYSKANPNGISNNIIRNIFEDSDGNIWFATGNGLCKLSAKEKNKAEPIFKIYKTDKANKKSINHNYILSIYESSLGELWFGTFGGGLNKFIPATDSEPEGFISYSEANGLPNNVIKGILEDEDNMLWLSTNQGLSKFDTKNETFKNYDVYDGLQSNEFQELACLKRESGEMLFGGVNGFNVFFPRNINDNSFLPETIITNLYISNEHIKVGEKSNGRVILEKVINDNESIQLKFAENSFSFEFASLHYAAPEKNQFAYKLEGFDEKWIYANSKRRFANYTNIEPGDYIFKVKASNNDGLWDATPSEIQIEIIPPFWRTGLAYLLYALLGIAMIIGFWRYTIISTVDKHRLELEHVENEKQEELHRIKLEFFTNISHELKTPLTLIKGPLEYLQKSGDALKKEEVHEQYGLMHKNATYLLRLINQLLDFRKINQGKMRLVVRNTDIVAFIKEVAEPFEFLAHKQSINFSIVSSENVINSWFDHSTLEKIINNLLSNAFKFTPEGGTILVDVSVEQKNGVTSEENTLTGLNNIVIQVKDSGIGIPKRKLNNIFDRFYTEKDGAKKNPEGVGIGLSFTKNLVELHQGNINVISTIDEGTSFIIKLPKDKISYINIPEISLKDTTDNDFLVRSSEIDSFAIDLNDEIADENFSKNRPKLPILLVVDDNSDIRQFIKQVLGANYSIYEAEDGEEGYNMASSLFPNIVLTDLLMPKMNGIELCEKLKTNNKTSHIPVLILTAKSSQESEIEGLKHGADDYIRKPFDIELLQIKLDNILKRRNELRKRFNRDITLNPKEVTVTSLDELFLKQAIEIVEKHMINTDFNVEMLVKEMGHSRSNLYLKFKELTGLSSSEFIRNIRLKRAVQLFESSDYSVKEIMYMTGFNTASYFAKCFKKQFGVKPSEYVRKNNSLATENMEQKNFMDS